MASVRVPGFTPKTSGFRFANAWPHVPLYEFQLGTLARLSIGDAANGLCGGMSFAVADLHAAGLAPGDAPRQQPPARGTTTSWSGRSRASTGSPFCCASTR